MLRSLLSQDRPKASNPSTKTIFHLQDYNRPVLALVTLPNLLLASLPFFPPETLHQPDDSVDVEETVPDLSVPGTLNITPQVKDAFKSLLDHQEIELKFTYGHWSGLADELKDVNGDEKYDLVLTAETIYSEDSVEDLMAVLKNASRVGERRVKKVEVGIADELEDLQVKDKRDETSLADNSDTVVLVAAKVST